MGQSIGDQVPVAQCPCEGETFMIKRLCPRVVPCLRAVCPALSSRRARSQVRPSWRQRARPSSTREYPASSSPALAAPGPVSQRTGESPLVSQLAREGDTFGEQALAAGWSPTDQASSPATLRALARAAVGPCVDGSCKAASSQRAPRSSHRA